MTDLASVIAAHLAEHGEQSAHQVAKHIHRRAADVLEALRTDERFYGPVQGADGRLKYGLSADAQGSGGNGPFKTGSHNARLLAVLSDGREHSHRELYGLGIMVHSRVADLRRRGYRVEKFMRREHGERLYMYRLVSGPLSEEAVPAEAGVTPPGPQPDVAAASSLSVTPGQLTLA